MHYEEEFSTKLEQNLYQWYRENRKPIYGILELTPLCNMSCDMCYVKMSRTELESQGRLRTVEEWIALAEEMKKAGVLFVLLTGGEPLTYPGFRELYVALHKMGMILTVNTNGTLLDADWVVFFERYRPRRLNITLYGADDQAYEELCHYPSGFERVISAIRLLRKKGVDVRMSSSLTKKNVADRLKIVEIGKALDVPVLIDSYMFPAQRERLTAYNEAARLCPEEAARASMDVLCAEMGEEAFFASIELELGKIEEATGEIIGETTEETIEEAMEGGIKSEETRTESEKPRGMSCSGGRCSFTVNWQGKMRPCVVMTGPETDPTAVGFLEAWNQLVQEVDKIFLNLKCSKCELRTFCQTCPACAFLEGGSYDAIPEYMCEYTRYRLHYMKQKYELHKK